MKKILNLAVSCCFYLVILFILFIAQVGAEYIFEKTVSITPVQNVITVILAMYIDRDLCNLIRRLSESRGR